LLFEPGRVRRRKEEGGRRRRTRRSGGGGGGVELTSPDRWGKSVLLWGASLSPNRQIGLFILGAQV